MKVTACCASAVLLFAGARGFAQEVYRTVDESGTVTYTDRPPASDAKSNLVDLPPGPSQERIEEARQRVEQEWQMSNELEQSRRQLKEQRKTDRERRAQQAGRQGETALPGRAGRDPSALPPDHGDRQALQKKLDSECEAARETKLAPERASHIAECVEKKQKSDRAACERFYSDYGRATEYRLPLYYDLPECVKAFEFRNSYRQ